MYRVRQIEHTAIFFRKQIRVLVFFQYLNICPIKIVQYPVTLKLNLIEPDLLGTSWIFHQHDT